MKATLLLQCFPIALSVSSSDNDGDDDYDDDDDIADAKDG